MKIPMTNVKQGNDPGAMKKSQSKPLDYSGLLSDEKVVGTAPVGTAPVGTAPKKGLYDKRKEAYPENLKIRLKAGITAMLKQQAQTRGFDDMSALTRAALKFALNDPTFRKPDK
jgi:hypothetical protein